MATRQSALAIRVEPRLELMASADLGRRVEKVVGYPPLIW
jgi:hypothetical protein